MSLDTLPPKAMLALFVAFLFPIAQMALAEALGGLAAALGSGAVLAVALYLAMVAPRPAP